MAINSSHDADVRLVGNAAPITKVEVRELIPYLRQVSEGGIRRLNAELALQSIDAIQKFDESSTKLSRQMVWLTWALVSLTVVLVFLTAVITWFTVLLVRRP